ncbi:MAG: hypothetical protein H0T73_04535 [Ardenticatenales bacterium]|nr:hypothetical protein [Ardenticatenales bacterium]
MNSLLAKPAQAILALMLLLGVLIAPSATSVLAGDDTGDSYDWSDGDCPEGYTWSGDGCALGYDWSDGD